MFGSVVMAQNGTLKGKVTKLEDGAVSDASMTKIRSLTSGKMIGITDIFGAYQISLPAGEHKVIFEFTGLEKDTVLVNIEPSKTEELNIELLPSTLNTITVMGQRKVDNGGVVTITEQQKKTQKVVTVQTRSELSDKGAGDVAAGAKKMTGMSMVGNVLYVRGLGDRYNVAYLNGLPVPSPNPDFRVTPLNVFPTDIISSLSVSKVMSSELYGDFSGGAFNIVTRSYLDKPTLSVSVGTGINSQTTFQDFKTYQGGKTDYFGVDDGTRDIPEFVTNNSQPSAFSAINTVYPNSFYNSVEGKSTGFIDNFGTIINKAAPNSNFSIMGGNFFEFPKSENKSSGIGFLALLNHDNSLRTSYGQIKLINAQSEERLNYDIEKYNRTTSSTGLLSLHVRMNPDHNITFNTLLVNTSNDETRDTWGTHFDYARNIYSSRLTIFTKLCIY